MTFRRKPAIEHRAELLSRIPLDPDPLGVEEVEAMTPTEFEAFIAATGFAAAITASLAELHRPRWRTVLLVALIAFLLGVVIRGMVG